MNQVNKNNMSVVSGEKWVRDNTNNYFTPGGDPVWICPVCGGDRHVMGIETLDNEHYRCRDCGAILKGYNY